MAFAVQVEQFLDSEFCRPLVNLPKEKNLSAVEHGISEVHSRVCLRNGLLGLARLLRRVAPLEQHSQTCDG
jgi:hypothetical protein